MRFRHPDGTDVLVSYCTNVHAVRDVADLFAQLDRYATPIREKLGWERLGLGLWLPRPVAAAVVQDSALATRLRRELEVRGLAVVTMNGFPYQDFHATEVKKLVYRPDWTDRRRLDYTLDLATVLAGLLPDGELEGTISTLPLGWRTGWTGAMGGEARALLDELDQELDALAGRTGRRIRVGLEPEPGCVVERADQVVTHLSGLGPNVGICLDTCHLAVGFETPQRFLDALDTAGLPLVKLQAACAVEVASPGSPSGRASLQRLAEPRYLHQVRAATGQDVQGVDDLCDTASLPDQDPWRVHFHAPLNRRHLGPLRTTQDVLVDTMTRVLSGPHPATRHIEVETYTWDVLPAESGAAGHDVVSGIAQELSWIAKELANLAVEGVVQ